MAADVFKKQKFVSDRVKAPRPNAVDWAKVVRHALALSHSDYSAIAFRFLLQPSRPNAPRPVAKSGIAVGSGVTKVNVPPVRNTGLVSHVGTFGGAS